MPKAPMRRLERDSNPGPFGRKATNLLMSHHAPHVARGGCYGIHMTTLESPNGPCGNFYGAQVSKCWHGVSGTNRGAEYTSKTDKNFNALIRARFKYVKGMGLNKIRKFRCPHQSNRIFYY